MVSSPEDQLHGGRGEREGMNSCQGFSVSMKIKKARVGCFKRTASKHVYYQG